MRCPHCLKEIVPQISLPGTAVPPAEERVGYPKDFELAWAAYPKNQRGNKFPAWQAWQRHKPQTGQFMAGLASAKNCKQWREGYAPHMSTWVNARGWEDDYAVAARGYEKGDLR